MTKLNFVFAGVLTAASLTSLAGAITPVTNDSMLVSSAGDCVDKRGQFPESPMLEEICRITNRERAKRNLKPLVLDPDLTNVAQKHAEDMARRDYFSHQSRDGDSPFDRMREAEIEYRSAGENIARGYQTPAKTMTGWMNSPGHRKNILNSNYGKIGIGYSDRLWVQDFTN